MLDIQEAIICQALILSLLNFKTYCGIIYQIADERQLNMKYSHKIHFLNSQKCTEKAISSGH